MEKEFIKLITTNQGIIIKVVNLYADTPADRDDLFQEVVFQLWKSYPRFKGQSKFTTWMYRVALNTALTTHKKNQKRKGNQSLNEQIAQIPEDFSRRELDEDIKLLYQAIQKLNDIERALTMLYLEEHSYQEIAQILGISESNVGVKLNRIKKKLKTILEPVYNGIG